MNIIDIAQLFPIVVLSLAVFRDRAATGYSFLAATIKSKRKNTQQWKPSYRLEESEVQYLLLNYISSGDLKIDIPSSMLRGQFLIYDDSTFFVSAMAIQQVSLYVEEEALGEAAAH